MTTLTLNNLISESDDFGIEDIRMVLDHVDEYESIGFGIDVIDWEKIGSGSNRQVGILFDKAEKRYGYYSDNSETVLVELDKTYQELSDWGNCWDECPEVLQES